MRFLKNCYFRIYPLLQICDRIKVYYPKKSLRKLLKMSSIGYCFLGHRQIMLFDFLVQYFIKATNADVQWYWSNFRCANQNKRLELLLCGIVSLHVNTWSFIADLNYSEKFLIMCSTVLPYLTQVTGKWC